MKIRQDLAHWLHLGLGGRYGFLTGDLEDRVIFDMLDHLGRPPGTYPESFVKIGLHLLEILDLELSLGQTHTPPHRHTLVSSRDAIASKNHWQEC